MSNTFQVTVAGKQYEAIAVLASHSGRAVLISMIEGSLEVGLVKLTSSFPMAVLHWAGLTDTQFLDAACKQFHERQMAVKALQSSDRPWIVELK